MRRANATRLLLTSCALATAVVAGWIVGSAGLISDDHRLLSIASPVVAGLAIVIAVVPSSPPQGRSAVAARRARPGLPAAGSASAGTRSASHVHIQRPPRDYFSSYAGCGRASGTMEGNQGRPDA